MVTFSGWCFIHIHRHFVHGIQSPLLTIDIFITVGAYQAFTDGAGAWLVACCIDNCAATISMAWVRQLATCETFICCALSAAGLAVFRTDLHAAIVAGQATVLFLVTCKAFTGRAVAAAGLATFVK